MPCYIITYMLTGPCAVNHDSVVDTEDQPGDHCLLHFQDGSQLRLEEGCETYLAKVPACSQTPPDDMPVYG
jgi:hypothetical protein